MGERNIVIPTAVWQNIRSSYAISDLPRLRENLLKLDTKNLSGLNVVIRNRLEEIFNFIDDIAKLDDPTKLNNRNLFLIYRNSQIINTLYKAQPDLKQEIFADALDGLEVYINENINPYLDDEDIKAITEGVGKPLTDFYRKRDLDPTRSRVAEDLPLLLSDIPKDEIVSFDTHIQLMVEMDTEEAEKTIREIQSRRDKLLEFDHDMRPIIEASVTNNVFDAFKTKLPSGIYIKISCSRDNPSRVDFKLQDGTSVPELEVLKDELNKDMDVLIKEKLEPIFSDRAEILNDIFYLVKIHRLRRTIVSQNPDAN